MAVAFLATLARSACLSNQTLQNLGFSTLNITGYTNSSICGNIYNAFGGCVDQTNVKNFITNADKVFKDRIDDGQSFNDVFNNLKNKVTNIFGNNNSTTDNSAVNTIGQNAVAARQSCLTALSLINHGLFCLLTSQAATSMATDLGSSVQVRANITDVGVQLEKCLPLIDATCTSYYGNPISISAVYGTNNTNTANITNATCTFLKSTYNCTDAVCVASRRSYLINNLFVTNDINFIPPKTLLDKISSYYNNAINWIKNLFSRRLATQQPVLLNADASGQSLASDGSVSGFAIPQAASAGLIFTSFITIMLALFA